MNNLIRTAVLKTVMQAVSTLEDHEVPGLYLVISQGGNPHGLRSFSKIKLLYTEQDGTAMPEDTKIALLQALATRVEKL